MWQAVFSFRPPAAERGSAMLASSPHLAGRSRGPSRQPGKGRRRRHSPEKFEFKQDSIRVRQARHDPSPATGFLPVLATPPGAVALYGAAGCPDAGIPI